MKKCPTCDSPKPHLHPAVQLGGEVQTCRDAFHLQQTNQNPPYVHPVMTDGPETPRLRAREHELRVMTRLLFTALGGDRHDNVDFKTIYEALNAAYEAGRQSGVLVRAGAKEPDIEEGIVTAGTSTITMAGGCVSGPSGAPAWLAEGMVAGAAPAQEPMLPRAKECKSCGRTQLMALAFCGYCGQSYRLAATSAGAAPDEERS